MSEIGSANRKRQGQIDRQLEQLGEQIAEKLSELSADEREALDCWKDGVLRDTYEVDVEALMERPYRSIRRIDKREYEYDIDDMRRLEREAKLSKEQSDPATAEKLRRFLYDLDRDR